MSDDPTRKPDPAALARGGQSRALPKRFYAEATAAPRGDGHAVHLDGRPLRTPGKLVLILPTAALADAIAAEWGAQQDHIDPLTMPLTRLANSVRDQVDGREREVRADIAKYAGSDLICYRADAPGTRLGARRPRMRSRGWYGHRACRAIRRVAIGHRGRGRSTRRVQAGCGTRHDDAARLGGVGACRSARASVRR